MVRVRLKKKPKAGKSIVIDRPAKLSADFFGSQTKYFQNAN